MTQMWSVSVEEDPLWNTRLHHHASTRHSHSHSRSHHHEQNHLVLVKTCLVKTSCSLQELFGSHRQEWIKAVQDSGSCGPTAVADYLSRRFAVAANHLSSPVHNKESFTVHVEPLERMTTSSSSSSSSSSKANGRLRRQTSQMAVSPSLTPYILERSDVTCRHGQVELNARLVIQVQDHSMDAAVLDTEHLLTNATLLEPIQAQVSHILWNWAQAYVVHDDSLMKHVAVAVVQETLRNHLSAVNGVAFVANGSILPRKSGATQAPMASPPAIPFAAPLYSPMCQTLQVAVPQSMYQYLPPHLATATTQPNADSATCNVSLTGLLVPRGVSLIAGGGYHGKSTLLRTIAAGVYNKIPGDGREFSVTVSQALNIRAEDGRYVNNCNVSAFISNLPTMQSTAGNQVPVLDTTHFSTGEASGSTSQASNVMEALELQTTCFLVDEDVSAANFMARDGRMRALVMDESITPLLYRVNGLFQTHGVSSVVVVGGVGDWLDVPHQVILMQKYACLDATAKAQSISKQFSHGHVQYGGRGVVHRLEWDQHKFTPVPRRPTTESAEALDMDTTVVGLLDGGTGLVFHKAHAAGDSTNDNGNSNHDMEEDRYIDMSRCEQLLGKKPQLFACGLAALWVLEASRQHQTLGLSDLLNLMDRTMDEQGVLPVLAPNEVIYHELVELLGHVYRPRRLEVGQAICRLRGVCFEELPREEDQARAEALAEEEKKKKQLMDLWNARRSNSK